MAAQGQLGFNGTSVGEAARVAISGGQPALSVLFDEQGVRRTREVFLADSIRIGSCGCRGCVLDIVLRMPPTLWSAIEIRAEVAGWTLSNLGAVLDVRCRNLEEPEQWLRVPPGRRYLPVPFEFTEVIFCLDEVPVAPAITVIGPEPACCVAEPGCVEVAPGEPISQLLRAGTAYMAVLDELCRGDLPTSAEIVRRLAVRGRPMSRRAVDHHIDYLCRRLLPDLQTPSGQAGWRRAALVALARRSGLVPAE